MVSSNFDRQIEFLSKRKKKKKHRFKTFSCATPEMEDEGAPRKEKGDVVSLATLQEAKPCSQIFTNHNVIKKKFADILQVPDISKIDCPCLRWK
jgi:hypothetical protein